MPCDRVVDVWYTEIGQLHGRIHQTAVQVQNRVGVYFPQGEPVFRILAGEHDARDFVVAIAADAPFAVLVLPATWTRGRVGDGRNRLLGTQICGDGLWHTIVGPFKPVV